MAGMARVPGIFRTQRDAHGLGNRSMIPMPAGAESRGSGRHRDDAKMGLPVRRSPAMRDKGGSTTPRLEGDRIALASPKF